MRRFTALLLVIPIPFLAPGVPTFLGHAATAQQIRGVARTPQNPFMAANGRSEIHDDAWQTDAYAHGGPLGRSPRTASSLLTPPGDCGSITFDRAGRIVSVCVGLSGPRLYMFDPKTLATLATFALPPRQDLPTNPFQDYTGGGYFYLDNHDRVVTATTTKHILLIAENAGAPGFTLVRDYVLSHVLTSAEKITSAIPDQHGLLWFVARVDGVVGTLNFRTGAIHRMYVGRGADGEIENSFATDSGGGVYIASNRKLYRFDAARGGVPRVTWQIRYPNSGQHKPGQVDDGTGTTPTVMPGGFVSITDNADPMDVVVYRTARRLRRHARRQVCRVPVFSGGASATENSLIGAGRAMVVENNYGYSQPSDITAGRLSAPGFARVDLNARGTGCRLVWTNRVERAPSVVPKLSLAGGLIYTYTKDAGASDPWYWTTIDFRTGRTVYKVLAGTGSTGYNNNYAGIALASSGKAEYLGTLGGIVALFDGS
jgi:hypothetical protein